MLGNFRIFSETSRFRIAPVTVLTGPNSSGKSTVAGSFSLMKDLDTSRLPYRLRFDNGHNPFGSFGMILNKKAKHKLFPAGYDMYNLILGENIRVMFTFEKGGDFDASVRRISISGKNGNIFDFRFRGNNIETRIGLGYLYRKLREIKESKSFYQEIERDFKAIRSSSGAYSSPQENDQIGIFHADREIRKKNISGYLRNHDIPTQECERMFYFYGRFTSLPGNECGEDEYLKRTRKVLSEYDDSQVLFNNELIKKILGVPEKDINTQVITGIIKKELPELFDCLALLGNQDLIYRITDLLKEKRYSDWESIYTESEMTTSKGLTGLMSEGELAGAIDHHLQSRFDMSDFFRAITELSMTREGFLQAYSRFGNLKALSSFCSLVIDKIIHDLNTDLKKSLSLSLQETFHGITLDFNHPMHGQIRNFSVMKEKDTFLKNWFRKFNVCDDFTFDTAESGMGYRPALVKNNENLPLSVEGAGLNRLVMMLLGIANARCYNDLRDYNDDLRHYPRTIIIEEPEAFLHPGWQSKLGDMFMDASQQLGINFIIETHSEYLINKLQYLVATGKLHRNDVVIYHLDNKQGESCHPAILEIVMDENGNLSEDIPQGFLDDEDRRAYGLFRLKKVSRN